MFCVVLSALLDFIGNGSIGLFNDKTNGSPGRPFIPRNRLKFGKAARIMFSLLLTLLTAPKDILNHD